MDNQNNQNNKPEQSNVDQVLSQLESTPYTPIQEEMVSKPEEARPGVESQQAVPQQPEETQPEVNLPNPEISDSNGRGKTIFLIVLNIILLIIALVLGIKIYERLTGNTVLNLGLMNKNKTQPAANSQVPAAPETASEASNQEATVEAADPEVVVEEVEKEVQNLNLDELDQPSSEIEQDLQQL